MAIPNFNPVPPISSYKNKIPHSYNVRLANNPDLAEKFHVYCEQKGISGTQVLLQLLQKLVEDDSQNGK